MLGLGWILGRVDVDVRRLATGWLLYLREGSIVGRGSSGWIDGRGFIQSDPTSSSYHRPSHIPHAHPPQTAAHFGVRVTQDDISREKAKGNANNDWVGWVELCDGWMAGGCPWPRHGPRSVSHSPTISHAHHISIPHKHTTHTQVLTQRLVAGGGVAGVTLEAVTAKFEEMYQGTATTPGLYLKERLIVPKVRSGLFTKHVFQRWTNHI